MFWVWEQVGKGAQGEDGVSAPPFSASGYLWVHVHAHARYMAYEPAGELSQFFSEMHFQGPSDTATPSPCCPRGQAVCPSPQLCLHLALGGAAPTSDAHGGRRWVFVPPETQFHEGHTGSAVASMCIYTWTGQSRSRTRVQKRNPRSRICWWPHQMPITRASTRDTACSPATRASTGDTAGSGATRASMGHSRLTCHQGLHG